MTTIATDAPARILDWDSEFFGYRIARATADSLSRPAARELISWAEAEAVHCVYFLADSDDTASVRAVEEAGFRLTDVRVTLGLDRADGVEAPPSGIEPATVEDISALRSIASESHRDTRFYHDGRFDPGRCDELYATWIEKSCTGYADQVLVARDYGGEAVGYISGHLDAEPSVARIGLIAVAASSQGRGVGGHLLRGALAWFASAGRPRVTVQTQGRNVAGLRLYEGLGFRVEAMELWFHGWSDEAWSVRS